LKNRHPHRLPEHRDQRPCVSHHLRKLPLSQRCVETLVAGYLSLGTSAAGATEESVMNLRVGPALVVIAIGAIFAFAVSSTAIPGINLNIAGIIVLLVGIIALVMTIRSSRPPAFRTVHPW